MGYKHIYDYFYIYNFINNNNFYKFPSNNIPYLNHKPYLKVFLNLGKYASYNINTSYNVIDNFPEIKEDIDQLFFIIHRNNINYIQIEQEILLDINKYFNISLNYRAIPFHKPGKISNLSRNIILLKLGLNYSRIKSVL